MKSLFLAILAGLAALSAVAWRIQPPPAPPGKIPLVWASDDNPTRRDQMALFRQLHPLYDLRLDPNTLGMEKVIVQSLAGVGPDLFDCYDGFQLSAYVTSGLAWDVTDRFRQLGIDVKRAVWPATHPNILHDGRVYGFPTNAAADAIWFHKDLFRAEGVPFPRGPWRWDQFLETARRMIKRDARGRIVRYGLMADWDQQWQQFVVQWGGRIYTPDGTRCIVDSPEAVAGVQFFQDLIYRHKVMPGPVEEAAMASQGGWGAGAMTLFGAKKGAMALGGRWWLNLLRSYEGLHLGACEAPHAVRRVFRGYGRATLVNSHSPRREHAFQFLRYMAGEPYNRLVNHQADAVSPVIRFAYTPEFLHDPDYPEEDYNEVWREALARAIPTEVSPFVNGQRAQRILKKQLDQVRANVKRPADALRDAARQINQEIRETVRGNPSLRARYEALTRGRSAP